MGVKDIFNKTSKVAKDIFDKTSKKTQELGEAMTSKMEVAKETHELKKVVSQIGQVVYDKITKESKNSVSLDEIRDLVEKAQDLEEEIKNK